ncbi:MAG TPA: hypothetical protein VGE31_02895 [Candidatus Paceibacterota bacterium]
MKRQDILSVLITFSIGFLAGGFLYLIHFSKLTTPFSEQIETQESLEEFVIISEAYGGCRSVCPSFRLTEDGEYRLQYYSEIDGERQFKEGRLSVSTMREVREALQDVDALEEQSEEVSPTACNSYSDGIDVRYNITLDGAVYNLDSCRTTVDGDGEIWSSLAKIGDYFRTVE